MFHHMCLQYSPAKRHYHGIVNRPIVADVLVLATLHKAVFFVAPSQILLAGLPRFPNELGKTFVIVYVSCARKNSVIHLESSSAHPCNRIGPCLSLTRQQVVLTRIVAFLD